MFFPNSFTRRNSQLNLENRPERSTNKSIYDLFLLTGKVPPRSVMMSSSKDLFNCNQTLLEESQHKGKDLSFTSRQNKDIFDSPKLKSYVDFDPNYKTETAEFTINPLNTTLHIRKTIPLLSDLTKQDVFQWSHEKSENAKACNWNEETLQQILISITTPRLQYIYMRTVIR